MSPEDLQEASARFHSDIATASLELEQLREHRFVEEVGELLVDAGELEDCIICPWQGNNLKIDGYYFAEDFGTLYLIVAHWVDESDLSKAKVNDSTINRVFSKSINFFSRSLKGLVSKIDVSSDARDLALLISENKSDINDVRILLITDGIATRRPAEYDEIDKIKITCIIWDIERILNYIEKGEREPIVVDFNELNGGPIPCLSELSRDHRYVTYLSYISGDCLSKLYLRWGTRLLEMNVRVFLSARVLVNRGIRDTILNEPDMFCAYNNGITVVARDIIDVVTESGMRAISRATDFQIVNGGQTVASLYYTGKKQKVDLSGIIVQMKLIVINTREAIDELVPRISEYSNTQNRVSMVDLSSNQPPHPELHEISKNLRAPDPTGGSRETYWFYEKARGSYEETLNIKAKTPAQRKALEAQYPKNQKFDKSLLGKAWNTFLRKPHIVCLGAQKNFGNFNSWLKEQKEDWKEFFRRTVALVMLWKESEKIVARQKFEGYRHAIVSYSLAWIYELTGSSLDIDRIWREQKVDHIMLDVVENICHIVERHIRETDKNVTEWCKKEDCWKRLREREYALPSNFSTLLISRSSGKKFYDPRIKAEIEIIEFCKSKGAENWFKLSSWLKQRDFLTVKARSQCYQMGRFLSQKREPSFVLSNACWKAWKDAEDRGWAEAAEARDDIAETV